MSDQRHHQESVEVMVQRSEQHDQEIGRWQNAIRELLVKRTGDDSIDGAGCDSGDPLDFTLSEINQGLNALQSYNTKQAEKIASLEKQLAQKQQLLTESEIALIDLRKAYDQANAAAGVKDTALRTILLDFQKRNQSTGNHSDGEYTQDYTTRRELLEKALSTTAGTAILQELEQLRADKERLDWLEQFFKHVGDPFVGFNDDPDIDCEDSPTGFMPVGYRVYFGPACEPAQFYVDASLRGAIDAARNPTSKDQP